MEHRLAEKGDLNTIMVLVDQARAFMKSSGLDQWQDGYPYREDFENDIEGGFCHLLCEDGEIAAVMTVTTEPDESYEHLHEGNWLTSGPYAAIHRVIVSDRHRGKGLGVMLISLGDDIARSLGLSSIRVDTHENNRTMRSALEKCGYQHRGRVFLIVPGDRRPERVVYEKLL